MRVRPFVVSRGGIALFIDHAYSARRARHRRRTAETNVAALSCAHGSVGGSVFIAMSVASVALVLLH
jgi:hypothetical protein